MNVFLKLSANGNSQLFWKRTLSLSYLSTQKVLDIAADNENDARTDTEWRQAKSFNEIPGPTVYEMLRNMLPGGRLYKKTMLEMNQLNRESWGDFYKVKGILGKPNMLATYNPKDFEIVYRNEGVWPVRHGMDTFAYYRKEKRPDIFRGIGGLISEQGKVWADIRNKVNPIMMKTNVVRQNLTEVDKIAQEFLNRLEVLRDQDTNVLGATLHSELEMWALEAVAYVALNARLGLLSDNPDPNGRRLAQNVKIFFEKSFIYDAVLPHFWKYYESAGFKELMLAYDNITNITIGYIDEAMKRIETEQNYEAKSVLEKLLRIDKQIALVMGIDMLIAGIDTTSATIVNILYHIAKNPDKQERLRKEIFNILPTAVTPLTEDNTRNMPYLRACMKEAIRIINITPANARTAMKDLVLSGYQVPKGTVVIMMGMALANSSKYFPDSEKYLPERWLKSGADACPAAKTTNPFSYLPFGFGPRTCVGKRIAEMEIETLLARIIRKYKVTWAGDGELQYKSSLLLMPINDKFAFKPL